MTEVGHHVTPRTRLRKVLTGNDPDHHVTEVGHHVTTRTYLGKVLTGSDLGHHVHTELRLHRRTKAGMVQLQL